MTPPHDLHDHLAYHQLREHHPIRIDRVNDGMSETTSMPVQGPILRRTTCNTLIAPTYARLSLSTKSPILLPGIHANPLSRVPPYVLTGTFDF